MIRRSAAFGQCFFQTANHLAQGRGERPLGLGGVGLRERAADVAQGNAAFVVRVRLK